MTNTKFGVRELREQFGSEEDCITYVFNTLHTRECSCGGLYAPMFWTENGKLVGRRQFQCSKCRHQIAPTAGTIFHKSDTPLTLWFEAILRFSNAKSGLSASQLARDLSVTYKTGWRILNLIRKALPQDTDFLGGTVEVDEMFYGGRAKGGKENMHQSRNMKKKSVVIGAVERGGKVRAKLSPDATAKSVWKFLVGNINPVTSRLMTDKSSRYETVASNYDRESVNHGKHEYVRGDVYVNTLEAFWAHVKRSVSGTHKVISKKYLQSYLDGFVWHRNNRHNDSERFSSLLGALLPASK